MRNKSEFTILERAMQTVEGSNSFEARIVLTLIYSAGLRSQEAINLKLSDIDFECKTIHIRQSKYKKDRIVPLSQYMAGNKSERNYPGEDCTPYRIRPDPVSFLQSRDFMLGRSDHMKSYLLCAGRFKFSHFI